MNDEAVNLTEEEAKNLRDGVDKPYKGLTPDAECWLVVGRGGLAFRYGPYTPKEAGVISTECVRRRVAVTLIANCGRDFDFELAEDLGVRMVLPEDQPNEI